MKKCTACTVDSTSPANTATDVTEAQRTTQGQGDVHQIVHAAVLESPTGSTKVSAQPVRKEMEAETIEATDVSIGLLYQLIEELESKTIPASSKDDALLDATSKRSLFTSEEEEQLVRTIESNVGDVYEIGRKTLRESESATSRFRVIKVNCDEELESHSSQHVTGVPSALREVDLKEIHVEDPDPTSSSKLPRDDATMEQILPVDAKKRKTSSDAMKMKKKGLGSRLRRLFRIAFGRREN